MGLDVGVVRQRRAQLGDGRAHAGAVAVQGADVECEANGVHAALATLP
jgi:hypothetical protein